MMDQETLSDMTTPGNFHRFKEIPRELRHMIWTFQLRTPRVVSPILQVNGTGCTRWIDRAPPVLLRLCHESRQEALRHFNPYLRRLWTEADDIATNEQWKDVIDIDTPSINNNIVRHCDGIFVNLLFDTICIDDVWTFQYLSRLPRVASVISRVILDVDNESYDFDEQDFTDYSGLLSLETNVDVFERICRQDLLDHMYTIRHLTIHVNELTDLEAEDIYSFTSLQTIDIIFREGPSDWSQWISNRYKKNGGNWTFQYGTALAEKLFGQNGIGFVEDSLGICDITADPHRFFRWDVPTIRVLCARTGFVVYEKLGHMWDYLKESIHDDICEVGACDFQSH